MDEARVVETEMPDGSIGLSRWVPFGEGLELPEWFTYEGTGPFNWAIAVRVIDGKPECVGLVCGIRPEDAEQPEQTPISAEALRRLPLGRLVEEAALMAARPVDEVPRRLRRWKDPDEARAAQAKAVKQYRRVKRSPRQHIDVTDERLEEVARIYRANVAKGRPTAAVGEQLKYSRSRAGSLVMEARRRGFLPPTEPRKARG